MTAQLLDGKATAGQIKAELAERVKTLAESGITPGLGTVLVGDDPGSRSYVAGKHRDCAQVHLRAQYQHHAIITFLFFGIQLSHICIV